MERRLFEDLDFEVIPKSRLRFLPEEDLLSVALRLLGILKSGFFDVMEFDFGVDCFRNEFNDRLGRFTRFLSNENEPEDWFERLEELPKLDLFEEREKLLGLTEELLLLEENPLLVEPLLLKVEEERFLKEFPKELFPLKERLPLDREEEDCVDFDLELLPEEKLREELPREEKLLGVELLEELRREPKDRELPEERELLEEREPLKERELPDELERPREKPFLLPPLSAKTGSA